MQISTIGLDLAKNVLQVHGVDAVGNPVLRKKLRRADVIAFFTQLPSCLVGMEACASAHHWARELTKLGHSVRLIPPSYVKPFVRRGKNDAIDAEAICEAVGRPGMRFVPVKDREQQAVLMLHRTRALLVRQRTMIVNALRAHLAEFGIIAAKGIRQVPDLIARILSEPAEATGLPMIARTAMAPLIAQIEELTKQVQQLERRLLTWHKTSEASQRLATIPGVGLITATALAATVTDPLHFRSGRQFAAWLGLTPRQNSSGGKDRLGSISKMGDRYLRTLLIVGATGIIRYARSDASPRAAWINGLLAKKPARLVSVALANKTARIAWAILARGQNYRVAERSEQTMTAAA